MLYFLLWLLAVGRLCFLSLSFPNICFTFLLFHDIYYLLAINLLVTSFMFNPNKINTDRHNLAWCSLLLLPKLMKGRPAEWQSIFFSLRQSSPRIYSFPRPRCSTSWANNATPIWILLHLPTLYESCTCQCP